MDPEGLILPQTVVDLRSCQLVLRDHQETSLLRMIVFDVAISGACFLVCDDFALLLIE